MLHVPTSKGEAHISFQHFTKDEQYPRTLCRIWFDLNKDAASAGAAYCHPKDNFCKATGRKIALRRVLVVAKLPRQDREAIWREYLNTQGIAMAGGQ